MNHRAALRWARRYQAELDAVDLLSDAEQGLDKDHTLIVAGAGTGKTSAVVGKIGFLIESAEVAPSDILALAFGKNAAEEMRSRVQERTGYGVEIRTFHALGFQIVADVEGEKPGSREIISLFTRILTLTRELRASDRPKYQDLARGVAAGGGWLIRDYRLALPTNTVRDGRQRARYQAHSLGP